MANTRGLGRGLDALLGGGAVDVKAGDLLRTLNVSQLQPGKYQPRTRMDQESWSGPSPRKNSRSLRGSAVGEQLKLPD